MLYCTKHGNQCDCPGCVREQFAETLAEASIKRLKLYNRIKELEKMSAKTVSAFDHMLDEKDRRIKELEDWNKIDETESDKLRNRIEELEAAITRCVAHEDCIEENGVKYFLDQWADISPKAASYNGAGNDYRECLQRIQNTLQEYQDRGVAPYASGIQMIIDEIQRSFDRNET